MMIYYLFFFFFFSSRRRHTRCSRDWSSDVCSSDLGTVCVGRNFCYSRQSPLKARTKMNRNRLLKVLIVALLDRKSTRLNSSHGYISYAVFCLKKKKRQRNSLAMSCPGYQEN